MTDVLRRAKLDIERLKKKERRQRRMRCGGDSEDFNSSAQFRLNLLLLIHSPSLLPFCSSCLCHFLQLKSYRGFRSPLAFRCNDALSANVGSDTITATILSPCRSSTMNLCRIIYLECDGDVCLRVVSDVMVNKWWRIKMPLRMKGQSREEVDGFNDVTALLEASCWIGV